MAEFSAALTKSISHSICQHLEQERLPFGFLPFTGRGRLAGTVSMPVSKSCQIASSGAQKIPNVTSDVTKAAKRPQPIIMSMEVKCENILLSG